MAHAIELADGNTLDCYSHYSLHTERWTIHLHACRDGDCHTLVLSPEQAQQLVLALVDVVPAEGDEGAGLGPLGRLALPPLPPPVVGGPRLLTDTQERPSPTPCAHPYHGGDGTDHRCHLERGHGGLAHRDATHTWAAVL